MKRYFAGGMGIVAIIIIGTLSGFLIRTNSELGETRGTLSSHQNSATAAAAAAAATQDHQFGLSTEAVTTLSAENHQLDLSRSTVMALNLGLIDKNSNLQNQLSTLQNAVYCSNPITTIDFTNNSTVSKALVTWVGDKEGSNLTARWEVIFGNARDAIHRITGKYLWVFIVSFEDKNLSTRDAIYNVGWQCLLYIKS